MNRPPHLQQVTRSTESANLPKKSQRLYTSETQTQPEQACNGSADSFLELESQDQLEATYPERVNNEGSDSDEYHLNFMMDISQ